MENQSHGEDARTLPNVLVWKISLSSPQTGQTSLGLQLKHPESEFNSTKYPNLPPPAAESGRSNANWTCKQFRKSGQEEGGGAGEGSLLDFHSVE